MKTWILMGLLGMAVVSGFAQPVTVVNTLTTRPVFTVQVGGVNESRTIAPGNRIRLTAGLFSGLGEKRVTLSGGQIYYLANLTGQSRLYRLPSDQVLILNQSGRAIHLKLTGDVSAESFLATGALALGNSPSSRSLAAEWSSEGAPRSKVLEGGLVYRLLLDGSSPGEVNLVPWD